MLSRRELLAGMLGAAAVTVVGCSTSPAGGPAASQPASGTPDPTGQAGSSSASGTPSASASAVTTGVTTHAWVPGGAEYEPAVKLAAVRLVEAIAAWPAGQGGPAEARRRVSGLGLNPVLADQSGPLMSTHEVSSAQVVDAQYAGIRPGAANVMVVVRWWRRTGTAAVQAGGTTLQVLMTEARPRWRITQLIPAAPGAAAASPPALATRVLANPRIRLPYAAHADVATGTIATPVLQALLALARTHTLDVSVVRSGHPLHVFGTSRVSDHPRGRAVDIWAVDDRPLVDPANRALTERVMRQGSALGAWQVGGPIDLDGVGLRYFSDHTHHDHIHLGFG
jgi:hypothetical protein